MADMPYNQTKPNQLFNVVESTANILTIWKRVLNLVFTACQLMLGYLMLKSVILPVILWFQVKLR